MQVNSAIEKPWLALTTVMLLSTTSITLASSEFTSNIQHPVMTVWDAEAQNNLPAWVCIWLKMLFASFVVGLLFSWKHSSARWLVGSFVASMFAIGGIFPVLGVSVTVGLIALVHILLRLPGLFVFVRAEPLRDCPVYYRIWSLSFYNYYNSSV